MASKIMVNIGTGNGLMPDDTKPLPQPKSISHQWGPVSHYCYQGPPLLACISNNIHYKVWYEVTYPFPNFNGVTVEVYEWASNFIPRFIECGDYLSMLGFKLIHVISGVPQSQRVAILQSNFGKTCKICGRIFIMEHHPMSYCVAAFRWICMGPQHVPSSCPLSVDNEIGGISIMQQGLTILRKNICYVTNVLAKLLPYIFFMSALSDANIH